MFGSGKTGRRLQRLLELHSIQFPKLIVLPGEAIERCRFDYDNHITSDFSSLSHSSCSTFSTGQTTPASWEGLTGQTTRSLETYSRFTFCPTDIYNKHRPYGR